jgi:hypothetical protein
MYFMKVRSEIFVVFKIFKCMVENLKDLKINTLHLDWGEYISKKFIEFFQWHGIMQQLTIVDTLHQNGIVGGWMHIEVDQKWHMWSPQFQIKNK